MIIVQRLRIRPGLGPAYHAHAAHRCVPVPTYVRTYAYAHMRGGCAHAQYRKNVLKLFIYYYGQLNEGKHSVFSPVVVIEKQKGKKKEGIERREGGKSEGEKLMTTRIIVRAVRSCVVSVVVESGHPCKSSWLLLEGQLKSLLRNI